MLLTEDWLKQKRYEIQSCSMENLEVLTLYVTSLLIKHLGVFRSTISKCLLSSVLSYSVCMDVLYWLFICCCICSCVWEYRSVCVCVPQMATSCKRTWCYLWNDRKREWWFTDCFLQQKPLFSLCVSTSPHPTQDQTTTSVCTKTSLSHCVSHWCSLRPLVRHACLISDSSSLTTVEFRHR